MARTLPAPKSKVARQMPALEARTGSLQIFGRVDAVSRTRSVVRVNGHAVFQSTQLLELFDPFQGAGRQLTEAFKACLRVSVDADMGEEVLRLVRRIPVPGHGGARK